MATDTDRQLAGVLGFFDSPQEILVAMEKVRDQNYASIDAYTPFPVHGMDEAQGLTRSWLPWITFCAGLTGFICAFSLQYWTSAVDWPINVGGKPLNSWPAFVPIMFELTVLFAGISTVVGMVLLNRLPNVMKRSFDPSLTRDKFAIIIEAPGNTPEPSGKKPFEADEASRFLTQVGAKDVRKVYQEGWF